MKKKIIALVLFLAFALAACGAKTTSTPVPTVPPVTPSPTPQPVLFNADFASEQKTIDQGWYLGGGDPIGWTWSPNKLTGSAVIGPYWTASAPAIESSDGYEIQVQAQPTGDGQAEYGVLFRADGSYQNSYLFIITTDGQYALWRYENNDWAATIIPYTASAHIHTGNATNNLDVLVAGTGIGLSINGFPEASLSDVSLPIGGYAGLVVRSSEKTRAEVGFSQFKVLKLSPVNTVLYQTDFASQQRASDDGWVFGDVLGSTWSWEQNAYTLSIPDAGNVIYQCPHGTYQDFYATTQTKSAGLEYAEGGIVILAPNQEDFLMFGVTTGGYYYLTQDVKGKWTDKIEYTHSDLLHQGQDANTLSVLRQGDKYFLFINEGWVATMAADGFSGGYVGAFGWSGRDGNARMSFSRFEVDSADMAMKSDYVASAVASHSEAAVPDDGSVAIDFVNHSNTALNLFWVDAHDQDVQYGSVEAGATARQRTYPTQVWRVRNAKGNLVQAYTVTADKQQTVPITQQMVNSTAAIAALPPKQKPTQAPSGSQDNSGAGNTSASSPDTGGSTDASNPGSDTSASGDTSASADTGGSGDASGSTDSSAIDTTNLAPEPTQAPVPPVVSTVRPPRNFSLSVVDASVEPTPNKKP